MTANFVDQFGFNDEEFSEHDENIKLVETHKQSPTRPTIAIATTVFYDECLVTLFRVPCGHGKPGKSKKKNLTYHFVFFCLELRTQVFTLIVCNQRTEQKIQRCKIGTWPAVVVFSEPQKLPDLGM